MTRFSHETSILGCDDESERSVVHGLSEVEKINSIYCSEKNHSIFFVCRPAFSQAMKQIFAWSRQNLQTLEDRADCK